MKERAFLHYEYKEDKKSFTVSCLLQDGYKCASQFFFYELVLQ